MFKVSTAVFFEWGWETTCVLGDSDFCLEDIGLDQLAISIRDANYNRVLLLPFCACALYLKGGAGRHGGHYFHQLFEAVVRGRSQRTAFRGKCSGGTICEQETSVFYVRSSSDPWSKLS